MAFFGVVGPFVIGTIVGLLAGNFGGRADAVLMRILDVTVSFPYFVLVIAIVAVLQPGLTSYYISLTLVNWVSYARLVRSEVIVLRQADFVLAARTIGLGEIRVMSHHLLPNVIAPAVVFVFTDAVLTIVLGSSLGFLGLGVQPPQAEWGVMIAEGQLYLGHRLVDRRLSRASPFRCWHSASRWSPMAWPSCCIRRHDRRTPFSPSRIWPSSSRPRTARCRPCGASPSRLRRARCWASSARAGRARPSPVARSCGCSRGNARIESGRIEFEGHDMLALDERELGQAARRAHRDDLPESLDPSRSAHDRRPPGRRGPAGPSRRAMPRRRAGSRSSCWPTCASPSRSAASMPMRMS